MATTSDRNNVINQFHCIGIVGAGNMGTQMAIAFSEMGLKVSVWDVKEQNVDELLEWSRNNKTKGEIIGFHDINEFVKSLNKQERKLFLFSISHGNPAESVLGMIKGNLKDGDIVLDGGNEDYRRTQKRQEECQEIGVHWIGMGVSGGYQAARRGPSLSPGGDAKALETVMPLLELYAAKDPSGNPCVTQIGPGGSGHYVKMVHNGIEGGMLSTLAEAWSFLHSGLELDYEAIADIFEKWNNEGELRGTYLLDIAVDMLRTKRSSSGTGGGKGSDEHYVLDEVLDKVVQDDDDTEGTPYWNIMESACRHISAPTLATGHYLRIASGNRAERLLAAKRLQLPVPKPLQGIRDKSNIIEHLRCAVYCCFLASFCQGLEMITRASDDEGWGINLHRCLRVWRGGCIIQADGIVDLLEPVVSTDHHWTNLKHSEEVAKELHRTFSSLKEVVVQGTLSDQYIPATSASLEYLKYAGGTSLPTKFMEGQMDFFGAHGYNKPGVPGEDPGPVGKGAHHYEWRPAKEQM
ncbi:Fibritin/6-phosphogluconate dehydrogenase, C-terminal extension [Penicillium italicum]|uniref:6-phosphogluconate dehydrogenase, decarboxylating n=1 Tax=Penicillium italicum TaxID=40296 RepID=A0A0A2KKU4_PENIT|nr:Fibritin/6-phosphogluconate dehydrogenase, C-terminal extension [Penicillium italicum]